MEDIALPRDLSTPLTLSSAVKIMTLATLKSTHRSIIADTSIDN
jgi:hypothetical protein